MSLKSKPIPAIPEVTAVVAHQAFPKGNRFMLMRDELGSIFSDEQFEDLYPSDGQPAMSPWRLALITIMQFAGNLTDRQAAEAVQARIDWKYALSMELTASGFDHSVLCEFRQRLVSHEASRGLLDSLLECLKAKGLLKAGGRQRSDSTLVLGAVRDLNRLELVGETLRSALNSLAKVAPDWLRQEIAEDWFERYSLPFESSRLPEQASERQALTQIIGQDGFHLLQALREKASPIELCQLEAVQTLHRVWLQQYYGPEQGGEWRKAQDLPPCSQIIVSPYDVDVRYRKKRESRVKGYSVHLTETCDEDAPHLITDVQTTLATVTDVELTEDIQANLIERDLKPSQHIVDAGYIDADLLVDSQQLQIDLLGPVAQDPSWQRREATGYDLSQFDFDWQSQKARCPQGQLSQSWSEQVNSHGQMGVRIGFNRQTCQACPARAKCTRNKNYGRTLHIRPQAQHEALQTARQRQTTESFSEQYDKRAGIEGTVSQAVSFGLRRSRYKGLAKTHLQHVATAAAINLSRFYDWMQDKQCAKTRISAFAQLKVQAA